MTEKYEPASHGMHTESELAHVEYGMIAIVVGAQGEQCSQLPMKQVIICFERSKPSKLTWFAKTREEIAMMLIHLAIDPLAEQAYLYSFLNCR